LKHGRLSSYLLSEILLNIVK